MKVKVNKYLGLQGLSLIEVLVSIGIIGILGVISIGIFTQSLSTSSETNDVSKQKQNGELAIKIMEEAIRNAEAVVCLGVSVESTDDVNRHDRIVIRTAAGKFTRFRFVDPVPFEGTPTQNGYIARLDNLTGDHKTFCTTPPSTVGEVPITNYNSTSGVSVSNGWFIQTSEGISGKDTITIAFNVNPTLRPLPSVTLSTETTRMGTTIQVR